MSGAEQPQSAASRPPGNLLPILVATNSLGLAATSIYTPSLPAIARALQVSAPVAQNTMTVYLIAYGGGMLLVGPLSDHLGRRHLLIAGTALFALASALAACADRIEVLMLARALQAVGACTGMALGRAIVRDVFTHTGTARAMAAISVALGITPILAPLVGGYLQVWWGWRANFVFLALAGAAITAAVLWRIPETRQAHTGTAPKPPLLAGLSRLLRERRYLGYTLVVGGTSSMFYAFLTAAPLILIARLGVTPDAFGRYLVLGTCGTLMSSMWSRHRVAKLGVNYLIRIGVLALFLAALLLALLAAFVHPWAIVSPLFLVALGMGLCLPNANAGGLGVFPQFAGAAAGLSGCIQMIFCSAAALTMTATDSRTALPLAGCWLCAALVAAAGALLARTRGPSGNDTRSGVPPEQAARAASPASRWVGR
jgi:DHA1 family bicyclomycin/chloramphenicol resistance-like MFS transporter